MLCRVVFSLVFLAEYGKSLGIDPAELRLELARSAGGLHHLLFVQVVDGVPVEFSRVKVHVKTDGEILTMQSNVRTIDEDPVPRLTEAAAAAAVVADLGHAVSPPRNGQLVFLPGHSCGHAGFLDKRNRIFFCGDDACFGAVGIGGSRPDNPYAKYASVEGLYDELVKITVRMDEFDGLFPGHGPVDAGTIMLVNVMEACKEVLDDPDCYDNVMERTWHGVTRTVYRKKIYHSGYLLYGKDRVYLR